MSIQTQSADGVIHQFPDGTPDAVIDKAMKDYAVRQAQTAPASATTSPPGTPDQALAAAQEDVGGPRLDFRHPMESLGDMANATGNVALGGVSAFLGIPGDVESLVRWASRNGRGVSQDNFLPTTTDIENDIAGAPANRAAAVERGVGSFLSPFAAVKAARLIGSAADIIRPTRIPDDVAAAQYVNGIVGKSGKALADIATAVPDTKPFTFAEAAGPQAQTNVMALARREGASGTALNDQMAERAASRPQRIMDDMASAAGIDPDAAQGNIDALVAKGQQKGGPLFGQALKNNAAPVWNDTLAGLSQRPVVQRAIKAAYEQLQNSGKAPEAFDFEINPETGRMDSAPTPEAWDLIRKNVNASLERDQFGRVIPDSQSPGNTAINAASRDLTGELRSTIPGYGDALDVAGDYLSAKSAFDLGQKSIFNPNVSAAQFSKAADRMTPAEQEALKGGVANQVFNLFQQGRFQPKTALTPLAQAKLSAALGPDKARSFIANLQSEAAMKAFEQRAMTAAGSQTAPLAQAMKDQDAFNSSPLMDDLVSGIASGSPVQGAKSAAKNFIAGKVQGAIDATRTRGLSVGARDAAGKLLLMSPADAVKMLQSSAQVASPVRNASVFSSPAIASNPALRSLLLNAQLSRLVVPQGAGQQPQQ